jgi:putative Holliday junction resolvase
MNKPRKLLGLDVGTVRIGVALADGSLKIAIPHGVIAVDGNELEEISRLVAGNDIDTIVVGYPRNQSGEVTAQTAQVEAFAENLKALTERLVFHDESLSSVRAEERLAARGTTFKKEEVDAEAAAIILQDYMEQNI